MEHSFIRIKGGNIIAGITLGIFLGISYAHANWSVPSSLTASAPIAPLFVSGGIGTKEGRLVLNITGVPSSIGLRIAGGRTTVGDAVKIGQNISLGMEGNIRASSYCNETGNVCVEANRLQSIVASIPQGAIAPFEGLCPAPDWEEYAPLKGKYPIGAATSGSLSGGQHSHGKHPYYPKASGEAGPNNFSQFGTAYYSNDDVPYYKVLYCKKVTN